MTRNLKALGIMNGTSLDGIDYALIEVDKSFKRLSFLKHRQMKIPAKMKLALLNAATNKSTSFEVSHLHFELGKLYGQQVGKLGSDWKFDIVGMHGQTIHHQGKVASLQIGHPGFIKNATGKPVYFDFRAGDVIAGGQGAPFAPFFQNELAKNLKHPVAFHNLGGISNLTFVNKSKVIAFDTGPANILLDAWMLLKTKKAYDDKGKLASKGLPDPLVVNAFLKHPYFKKKAPKSTGREEFNLHYIKKWGGSAFNRLNLNDQLATLTEVTAMSIADDYKGLSQSPKSIYFYGGGINNRFLMDRISFYMNEVEILMTDQLGWPAQAFEASIFAFLGAARHFQKKVHLPEVTGAKNKVVLGSLYL